MLTIILFTILCLLNVIIHHHDLQDDPENVDLGKGEILREVLKEYWISIVGSFIAVLVSILNLFRLELSESKWNLFLYVIVQYICLHIVGSTHLPGL